MDLDTLEAYVVDQIAGGVKPDTVIFEVAQRQGWDWSQAELFVSQVTESRSSVIQRRQRPLLRVMSVVLVAAGTLLLGLTAFALLDYGATLSQKHSDLTFLVLLISVLGMFVGRELPQLIWGVALLLAGLIGWWRTMPPPSSSEFVNVADEDDPFSL